MDQPLKRATLYLMTKVTMLQKHPSSAEKILPGSESDVAEQEDILMFLSDTGKCKLGPEGKPCCLSLSQETIRKCRNNCAELTVNSISLVHHYSGVVRKTSNFMQITVQGKIRTMLSYIIFRTLVFFVRGIWQQISHVPYQHAQNLEDSQQLATLPT